MSSEKAGRKTLTVSVAAYNAEGWLGRCLESLVGNDAADRLDVIVVNDGSTDSTLNVARSYESRYPEIVRVIDKENGGHGSTINVAIDAARGSYFKTVDSDDWVEREGIEKLVSSLDGSDCDVAFNPFYIVDADSGEKRLSDDCFEPGNPIGRVLPIDEIAGRMHLAMHAMTFRTGLLKSSQYRLDEHCFYVDTEYVVYYFGLCETAMLLDWPVYDYLLGTAEQSMSFGNMIKRRKQHEKVCLACARFYEEYPDLVGKRERIIRGHIVGVTGASYTLLMCLPYGLSRVELPAFDTDFMRASAKLYSAFAAEGGKESNIAKVIGHLRSRDFKGFRLENALYRARHLGFRKSGDC